MGRFVRTLGVTAAIWPATLATAGVLYSSTLQQAGPEWVELSGDWIFPPSGLTEQANGEARIALTGVDANALPEYTVEFTATLLSGQAFGLFFGAGVDANNRFSGYEVEVRRTGSRVSLDQWILNATTQVQSNNLNSILGQSYRFEIQVSPTGVNVSRDGAQVLSYSGAINPLGTMVGFRTRSASQPEFRDFAITTPVNEPTTWAMMAIGLAVLAGRTVRHAGWLQNRPRLPGRAA